MEDDKKDCEILDEFIEEEKVLRAKAKKVMEMIDTNNDRLIDFHEMESFIEKFLAASGIKKKPDKKFIEDIFNELDTDKNGKICEEEIYGFFKRFVAELREKYYSD